MRHAILIAALCALPIQALAQAETQDEPPVGGIGRLACSAIIGAENAPYLGQAGDWALGYMAGRIDAGQSPVEGETLRPEDSVDVVAGIAMRCRETPDAPVITAVRAFADRVFGVEAEGGPVVADPPPPPPELPEGVGPPRETEAPPPRPEDLLPPGVEVAEPEAEDSDTPPEDGETPAEDGGDDADAPEASAGAPSSTVAIPRRGATVPEDGAEEE